MLPGFNSGRQKGSLGWVHTTTSDSIFAGDFDHDGKTCVTPTKYKRIKIFFIRNLIWAVSLMNVFSVH